MTLALVPGYCKARMHAGRILACPRTSGELKYLLKIQREKNRQFHMIDLTCAEDEEPLGIGI